MPKALAPFFGFLLLSFISVAQTPYKEIMKNALAELEAKNYPAARTYIDQAIRQEPRNAWAYNVYGVWYQNQQQLPQALDYYRTAVVLAPNYGTALANIGNLYFNSHRDSALYYFHQAIKVNPENPTNFVSLKNFLNAFPTYDGAEESYELATTYLSQKLYDSCLRFSNRAIDQDPGYALGYFVRGRCYLAQSRNFDAMLDFRKYTGFYPDDWAGWNNIGASFQNMKRFDSAYYYFRHAARMTGDSNYKPLQNSGLALAYLGQYEDAVKYYELARARDSINFDKGYGDYVKGVLNISNILRGNSELVKKDNDLFTYKEYFRLNEKSIWTRCPKSYADFYRIIDYEWDFRPSGIVRDYYASGELQWEGELNYLYFNQDENNKFSGLCTWYYKNGQKSQEATYNKSQYPSGTIRQWFEDGTPLYEGVNDSAAYRVSPVIRLNAPQQSNSVFLGRVPKKGLNLDLVVEDSAGVAEIRVNKELLFHAKKPEKRVEIHQQLDLPEESDRLVITAVNNKKYATFQAYKFNEYKPAGPAQQVYQVRGVDLLTQNNQEMAPLYSMKNYGLIIYCQDYADRDIHSLSNTKSDAQRIYQVLDSKYNFNPGDLIMLANPTRGDILQKLTELKGKLGTSDNLLIFYAGHGAYNEESKQGYWWPVDANKNVETNWISNSDLVDKLKIIKARHILVISDACFSGALTDSRGQDNETSATYKVLSGLVSRTGMTSGALNSVPDKSDFLNYLVEALEYNNSPALSAKEVYMQVFHSLKDKRNEQNPQYGKIYNCGDMEGDFIFVKKVKDK